MSKVTYQRFMLLLLCVLFACTKSEHPDNYKIKNFKFEDFPQVEKLEGTKLNIKELLAPRRILNLKDYLVVSDNRAEYLLYVIDKKNNKVVNSLGVLGRGPGEIQHAWRLNSTSSDSSFWVYQTSLNKISKFNVNQSNPFSIDEIDFIKRNKKDNLFHVNEFTFASDTSFMVTMIDGEDKYVEFDSNMNKLNKYDKWAHMIEEDFPSPVISGLYQGALRHTNDYQYFVLASINLDVIEILNKETRNVLSLKGPLNYKPKYTASYDTGEPMLAFFPESRGKYMYLDIACGKEQFYALFAKDAGYGGFDIFTFDYDGNLITHYELDKKIKRLTVDEQSHKFYGITAGDPEPNILVFEY